MWRKETWAYGSVGERDEMLKDLILSKGVYLDNVWFKDSHLRNYLCPWMRDFVPDRRRHGDGTHVTLQRRIKTSSLFVHVSEYFCHFVVTHCQKSRTQWACWHQTAWRHLPLSLPSPQYQRPAETHTGNKNTHHATVDVLNTKVNIWKHWLTQRDQILFRILFQPFPLCSHVSRGSEVTMMIQVKSKHFSERTHIENRTYFPLILTRAPSSWKMAEAPSRSSGAIFRLQRLRRNVSDERSFLWNFQPIRDENSQPSGSPRSLLCERNKQQ